ncbi:MAG: sulfatase [Candidatus Helarchaeota archaeon]
MTKNKKQNLILITIDTLRLDHLKIMGYKKNITPYLDKLAKKGIFFTQTITNGPWTLPSFSSIFTSIYPFHQGGYSPLPDTKTTLAEVLKGNGYLTMGIHSTPVLSRFYRFDRGFDIFYDALEKTSNHPVKSRFFNKLINNMKIFNRTADFFINFKILKRINYYLLILFYNMIVGNIEYYKDAERIFKKAVGWLESYYSNKNWNKKPYFLWIHLMDLHDPYFPKNWVIKKIGAEYITENEIKYIEKHPEYYYILREYKMTKKLIELYDSEIRYVDIKIQEFFTKLNQRGWLDNTLTIITADHGEEFNEHGKYGHNAQLYDELLRVPLIFISEKLKEIRKEGKKDINNLVNMRDLAPTILDLLELPPEPNFDGKSFADLIFSDKTSSEDPLNNGVFSETYHKDGNIIFSIDKDASRIISYRTIKWKYIIDENNLIERLYDLENDPKEKNNLAEKNRDLVKLFRKKVIYHIREKDVPKKNVKDIIEKKKIMLAVRKLRI